MPDPDGPLVTEHALGAGTIYLLHVPSKDAEAGKPGCVLAPIMIHDIINRVGR